MPNTSIIADALDYAQRLSEPYLFNHALRSWLFAISIARPKNIDYDSEVVAVGTEVAVGTMGIGLDWGGFGIGAIPASEMADIVNAFPRLKMKEKFAQACCHVVEKRPETSSDNFLRDFGERFVPGYKVVSAVDVLMNAPFEE